MAWAERLPSGKFRGVYRDAHGKRRSAGTFPHKTRAERAAGAKEEAARRTMRSDPDGYRRLWGEWCDEWWPTRGVEPSTLKVDASRRRVHLDPRWATVPVGSIRRHDIREWAASMQRRGTSAATVQRAVRLLSVSLSAAVDAEILEANPAAGMKLPQAGGAMERFLTKDELAAIVAEMPTTRDQLIAQVLAYTGLRWGEMAGLHSHRLDLERGTLRVVEVFDEKDGTIKAYPKGRHVRDVPVPGWLVEKLEAEAANAGRAGRCGLEHTQGTCRSALVFTTESGTVMRNSNWSAIWRGAVELAGVDHARIHDLRHTYCSWLIQAGVPIAEVGRLAGHVSTSTTQRYAHLADVPTDAVLAALGAPLLPHAALGD